MSYSNNYSYYGPHSHPCCETCGTSPCECIGGSAGMAGRSARAEVSLKAEREQTERDPRMHPLAGDRLLFGSVHVRVSPCGVDGLVFYERAGKPCQVDLRGWREWCVAKKAKVLYKSEDKHD